MIVVDASAIVDLLLVTPDSVHLRTRLFGEGKILNAPHLLDVEVAHVLRRQFISGDLTPERATQILQDFLDLPLRRYSHYLFLPRIWELRHNITAYDAAYVALAEALDAPLLTRDRALASSSGHSARIELV